MIMPKICKKIICVLQFCYDHISGSSHLSLFCVFAWLFCSNDQKQATSSPTHISPSHQKWQNITRSWPKMDLSSYVEPLCVCVCQVGLWFLSTRMSQHANSFVNFTLFCGEFWNNTKTLKRRKLTSYLWAWKWAWNFLKYIHNTYNGLNKVFNALSKIILCPLSANQIRDF